MKTLILTLFLFSSCNYFPAYQAKQNHGWARTYSSHLNGANFTIFVPAILSQREIDSLNKQTKIKTVILDDEVTSLTDTTFVN